MKRLKIGILTLQGSYNCGSMLQAYALQRVIFEQKNADVELIDFTNTKQKNMYSFPQKDISLGIRPSIYNIRRKIMAPLIEQQINDYKEFKKRYLVTSTSKYEDGKELIEKTLPYNVYISGSDQIWNVLMEDFDEAYFLGWVRRTKKIAYAPSTGGNSPITGSVSSINVVNWLKEYSFLSVRDEISQKYIKEILGSDVSIVLDPTLLLNKEEWDELIEEPLYSGKYIFYYSYGYYSDEMNKIVHNYGKKHKMPIYVINASKWIRKSLIRYGFKLANQGGPIAFLNLMKYAHITFVESFHGVIFAYIFKKNFWFLNDNTNGKIDLRIDFLLKQLDMHERIIDKTSSRTKNLERSVNYTNKSIEDLKNKSLLYLLKAINET